MYVCIYDICMYMTVRECLMCKQTQKQQNKPKDGVERELARDMRIKMITYLNKTHTHTHTHTHTYKLQ